MKNKFKNSKIIDNFTLVKEASNTKKFDANHSEDQGLDLADEEKKLYDWHQD